MFGGHTNTTKKHKIQGAIILLLVEFAIGAILLLLLKQNYQQRTVNSSITEGSIYTALSDSDKNTNKKETVQAIKTASVAQKTLHFSSDQKNFSGLFGSVEVIDSDIQTTNKDIKYSFNDTIVIHADRIYYYYLLKNNIKGGMLDRGIFSYIILNGNRTSDIIIQELSFVIPNFKIEELDAYTKAKATIQEIKDANREGAISILQRLEQEYTTTLSENNRTDIQNYLPFSQSNAYTYVWNQLVIDERNTYKDTLSKASKQFSIDEDLIRATIFTEQLRGLTTYRGILKNLLASNKYLMIMSQFSYGLGGIKEKTAIEIENWYKEHNEDIYNDIFAYTETQNINYQRTNRLTSTTDYSYQIMYVTAALAMYRDQRAEAGYDISQKIGILTTLYNVGYKDPNPQPEIGGANIQIDGNSMSFGRLSTSIFYLIKSYEYTQ